MADGNGNGYRRLVFAVAGTIIAAGIIALAADTHSNVTDSVKANTEINKAQDSVLVQIDKDIALDRQKVSNRLSKIEERQKRSEKVDALILKALKVPQREWPDPLIADSNGDTTGQ